MGSRAPSGWRLARLGSFEAPYVGPLAPLHTDTMPIRHRFCLWASDLLRLWLEQVCLQFALKCLISYLESREMRVFRVYPSDCGNRYRTGSRSSAANSRAEKVRKTAAKENANKITWRHKAQFPLCCSEPNPCPRPASRLDIVMEIKLIRQLRVPDSKLHELKVS